MIYTIRHGACSRCKFKYRAVNEDPCLNCCHEYDDQFVNEDDDTDCEEADLNAHI